VHPLSSLRSIDPRRFFHNDLVSYHAAAGTVDIEIGAA